jgi:ADP-heptose:LPS heptosyltransferase
MVERSASAATPAAPAARTRGPIGADRRQEVIHLSSAAPLQPTVFFFHRLGDMVMLTALLQYLHRRYRRPCQVIGAGSWTAAVYQGNPDVSRVFSFHRHLPFPFSPHWPRVARALRESAPGPIYVCEHHYRQLPRIRRMLWFSGIDPARCVFISTELEASNKHYVDRLVRFGEQTPAGLRVDDYPLPAGHGAWAPQLRIDAAELACCDEWLRAQGWAGRKLILVQPGNHRSMSRRAQGRRARADDKSWPLERWAALLKLVHARLPSAVIILRGSKEEAPMLQQIGRAAGLPEVGVAGLTLRPFFALCARAHSMISVDTGPAHVAAALGVPLVVMFGAHWPTYWAPRSPCSSPVVTVGGPPETNRADQIAVETVFDAWDALLQRMEDSAGGAAAGGILHPPATASGTPALGR